MALAHTPCVLGLAYPTPLFACMHLDRPVDDLYGPLTPEAIDYALTAMMEANGLGHAWKDQWTAILEARMLDQEDREFFTSESEDDYVDDRDQEPEYVLGYDCHRLYAMDVRCRIGDGN
jgi:hypothetical protein